MKTVTITGKMGWQDGLPVSDGTLHATLTVRDSDGDTTILPRRYSAPVDPDGTFALDLWPNDLGQAGSRYRLVYQPADAGAASETFGEVAVFDAGPYELGDLLGAVQVQALLGVTIVSMSEAEYDAALVAGTLKPNVLYLTRP